LVEVRVSVPNFEKSKLPARFGHSGDETFMRHVAEADPANAEAAHVTARTSAQIATILDASRKLRLSIDSYGFSNFA
jgi:hypothetical protein